MVKINVNDKGECHVFVRGNWDDVKTHLLVAATKVRTMAADTRKFARAASGKTPLADLKRTPEEPKQEAVQAWQSQVVHPVPVDRPFGGMGTGIGSGIGGRESHGGAA